MLLLLLPLWLMDEDVAAADRKGMRGGPVRPIRTFVSPLRFTPTDNGLLRDVQLPHTLAAGRATLTPRHSKLSLFALRLCSHRTTTTHPPRPLRSAPNLFVHLHVSPRSHAVAINQPQYIRGLPSSRRGQERKDLARGFICKI